MHFVARIVVEKVDHSGRSSQGPSHRVKEMIANIAVSAPDIQTLRDKAGAHLNLIEDGGPIDDRVTR